MNCPAPQLSTRLPVIVFCLIFITGCAGFGRYAQKPVVTLADIRVKEIKTMESAFLVELRVLNPNEIPLEINGIECELEVDGKDFASGVAGGRYVVPAYGSALVPVTLYASMLDMVSSVVAVVRGASGQTRQPEPLRYALSGHVRLGEKNMFQQNLPFRAEGTLSFDGMR